MSITPPHVKVLGTLLVVPFTLALLTGCGSGAAGTGSTSGSDKTSPSAVSADDWGVAYAQCMRAEGIDFPDPGKAGKGLQLDSSNVDALKAAATKCQAKLGRRPASAGGAESEDARMAAQLAAAQCLRRNGVDVPDPKPGTAMGIPLDVPDKVLQECIGASAASPTGVGK